VATASRNAALIATFPTLIFIPPDYYTTTGILSSTRRAMPIWKKIIEMAVNEIGRSAVKDRPMNALQPCRRRFSQKETL